MDATEAARLLCGRRRTVDLYAYRIENGIGFLVILCTLSAELETSSLWSLVKNPRVTEDIVPIGEFRSRSAHFLESVRENRRPVVITQNGRPAGVLISPEDFDAFQDELAYRRDIEAGYTDVQTGRTHTTDEVVQALGLRPDESA